MQFTPILPFPCCASVPKPVKVWSSFGVIFGESSVHLRGTPVLVNPVFSTACARDLSLQVGEVSQALGRGRHTTRHVEMFPVEEDTWVIDTPGFSSFDTEELNLELQAHLPETFPEFLPYLGQCRFVGVQAHKGKGCAVLEAVRRGDIPSSRHRSYVRLWGGSEGSAALG